MSGSLEHQERQEHDLCMIVLIAPKCSLKRLLHVDFKDQLGSDFPPPCNTGEPRVSLATGQKSATFAPISIPLRVSSYIKKFEQRDIGMKIEHT